MLPSLTMYIRDTCCAVNKGKIYLEKIKIKASNVKKANDSWFKK